jgi:hypothetical protein
MNKASFLLATFLITISSFIGKIRADGNDLYLVYNSSFAQKPNGARCLNLGSLRSLSFGTSAQRILKAKYVDNHIDTISTSVIDYLYIGSAPTRIENISSDNSNSEISLSGNMLKIRTKKKFILTVYSADGKQVINANLIEGYNTVAISALPGGMYIAHTASSTFKFCK